MQSNNISTPVRSESVPVVEHLLGHRPLRRPVEEHVDQEEGGDGDVEAGQALPAHLSVAPRRVSLCRCRSPPSRHDEVVETEGDGADDGHAADDVDGVAEEAAAVRHAGEDRLGEDNLPDVVSHAVWL